MHGNQKNPANDKMGTGEKLIVVFAVLCVFIAFAQFIRNNNSRAASLSMKSLRDATSQSSLRIGEVLDAAQNEIRLTAALYEELLEDSEVTEEALQRLSDETTFNYVEFINAEAVDLNPDGGTDYAYDRAYFQNGMEGNSGIDVIFDSAMTDENLVICYTPLYFRGKIIGVLAGSYTESKMQEIIYNTFFGEEARTFLCTREGDIIASCNGDYVSDSILDGGNFNSGLSDETTEELQAALLSGEEYEFQYQGTGGTGNAYLTTLGNCDWLLIQTYPSQVTSQIIQDANRAGIILLFELIVIFAVCLIVVLVRNRIQKKRLILDNTEKSYVVDGITQLFETFVLVDLDRGTYRYLAGTRPQDRAFPEEGGYEGLRDSIISVIEDEEDRTYISSVLEKENLKKNLCGSSRYLRCEYCNGKNADKWDSLNMICLKDNEDSPSEVLFAYHDVTETKKRERESYEALKEAYRAVESANRAKSDFLSNMSHDIRTPMNAIMGMTTIAAMNIDDRDRVKDCLNKITLASQHLLGLINEVLDMSKIESGRMVFAEEEFSLSDVVESIVTIFLPQTQAKNQEFKVNISDIAHEEVIGDRMRLQQIFVNILGNAVKFTPEGGRIVLGMQEKPSGMHGCGCYIFTFEDNGIGMDESFLEKLYEPFVRAENSRISKVEGTGLGMAIVKNIVQMMNGDIQVASRLNEGSTFTVTVYLRLSSSKYDDMEDLENLAVLVADDDRFACESACNILTEIGMAADWVLSGREAVDRIMERHSRNDDYSVVILDWKMPEMDGVETAREIRARVGEEVPIVILSAFDYSAIEQEARKAGVNAFISKPLFRSRLVYVMKSVIRGEDKKMTEIDQLQSRDYSGKRVLVVEDNEINMEIAEELLTEAGVTVEKAVNGRLAVELVRRMPENYFDMIFMDIQMPEMNGYEATAAIRDSGRADLRKIPVVAMSADVFMDDVKHAQDAGMNGHVAKPVEIENLLAALDKWI